MTTGTTFSMILDQQEAWASGEGFDFEKSGKLPQTDSIDSIQSLRQVRGSKA